MADELTRADIERMTADKSKWVDYANGNYHVWLNLEDGTKIRHTEDDEFLAAFPESMDIKITNACDRGCPACHEDSRPDGSHGGIDQTFIDTLHPYQEIAVGGGNVLSHPGLEEFLGHLRSLECIPSITVNQVHFMQEFDRIKKLYDDGLIFGIGISLVDADEVGFIEKVKQLPTAVIHTIVGLLSPDDVASLAGQGLKILLLGYKDMRRGHSYIQDPKAREQIKENTRWTALNLPNMMRSFNVLSFDNLALEQLPVRHIIGEEAWKSFYMGDDGRHTFYIDMVEQEFARSSTSLERHAIGEKTIDEMFAEILDESGEERGDKGSDGSEVAPGSAGRPEKAM